MSSFLTALTETDWGMHGDLGSGWGIAMIVAMMLFWAALFVLAVWLVRSFAGTRVTSERSPLEVLQHRLARGEISGEEYDRLREKLAPPG